MLTPADVEAGIEQCLATLTEGVHDLARVAHESAVAEVDYKVAFSQERLRTRARLIEEGSRKVTVDIVEDHATVATKDVQLAYRIATNALLTQREALRACQARLDGYRTIAASLRGATS